MRKYCTTWGYVLGVDKSDKNTLKDAAQLGSHVGAFLQAKNQWTKVIRTQ